MPTDTTKTVKPGGYAGWVREGGAWREVAHGRDHNEVWNTLLAHVVQGKHVERIVLPAGQLPTTRRPRR